MRYRYYYDDGGDLTGDTEGCLVQLCARCAAEHRDETRWAGDGAVICPHCEEFVTAAGAWDGGAPGYEPGWLCPACGEFVADGEAAPADGEAAPAGAALAPAELKTMDWLTQRLELLLGLQGAHDLLTEYRARLAADSRASRARTRERQRERRQQTLRGVKRLSQISEEMIRRTETGEDMRGLVGEVIQIWAGAE